MVAVVAAGCSDGTPTEVATGTAQGADATTLADGLGVAGQGDAATIQDTSAADQAGADGGAAGDGAALKYPLCSSVLTCLGVACSGPADAACAKPCLDGTSAANQQTLAPYLACIQQACVAGLCAGSPDPACMSQCAGAKCFAKALACGADGKSGDKGCTALLGCFTQCKDQGGSCWFDCYGAGSPPAQQQFDQLMACASAAGGSDPFASCPAQLLNCFADGKKGDASCAALWTCTSACEQLADSERQGCYGACWGQGTATAQQGWLAMVGCFTAPTPGCGAAVASCAAASGQATCLDTATCLGACDKQVPKDPACTVQCLQKASPAEAAKTAELMACIGSQCKQCNGQNPCQDSCMQSQCKAPLTACLAP
jgi:hypothetical protein